MSEQAQFRLDQLQKPVVEAQPKKDEAVALKSGARRYEVGDELVYERADHLTFKKRTLVGRVVTVDDNTVVFSSGLVLDQMGSILKDRFGEKDPGNLVAPADLALGKKWRSAFTNKPENAPTTENFWECRVVGMEEIVVPAGRFITFRIERRGIASGKSGTTRMTTTQWIDPKTMYPIKNERTFIAGSGRVVDETDVLLSLKQAPR